ncbi:hypothetical protein [Roseospira visakhapatnamensis]|uniref:Uncharacterized protein n=1 Tax=Roseospira visakhapatnamensis TaxID=390880 RepID=A0A7W6REA2_9PROT|nr:hypothetical protein [Roseospira visakhapatnamensis]MBB4266444.1 hypothetical protein [Roseospira visakhapatnamensis]
MVMRRTLVGLAVLMWASAASAAGLEAVLRCGPAGQPADLLACLGDGSVEISRDGEKTVAAGAAVLALGQHDDQGLHVEGPKNFSIQARNQSAEHPLVLEVRRVDGTVIFEQTARRFATVAFYRCGPVLNFECREYNYEDQ